MQETHARSVVWRSAVFGALVMTNVTSVSSPPQENKDRKRETNMHSKLVI